MNWMAIKMAFAGATVGMDALHIYAAILIQVTAAQVSRRPLSSWLPWCVVLIAEIANECLDVFWGETSSPQPWQEAGALHDAINTMMLPTVLMLLVRYAPALFRAKGRTSE